MIGSSLALSAADAARLHCRARLAAVLLALCSPLASCDSGSHAAIAAPGPRGVIFILMDTVRADHLSAYGYEYETTPTLTRLAAQGALLEQVQSPAPWTVPTMASLWTGVYPSRHGAGIKAAEGEIRQFPNEDKPTFRGFWKQAPTLARRLGELGYRTYGCLANPLVGSKCYVQDFDRLDELCRPANELVDWAAQLTEELEDERFFLYLHFMDAHQPTDPPDAYLTRFLPEAYAAFKSEPITNKFRNRVSNYNGFGKAENIKTPSFAKYAPFKIAAYDGAIRFLDDQLGRLFEVFEDEGLLEDTLVVVTADHGEELWDHWETECECYDVEAMGRVGIGHGHSLFQELLHVPLIMKGPGIKAGTVVPQRVSLIDLGSTILELVDPASEVMPLGDGLSFVEALRGESIESRLTVSEGIAYGYDMHAVIDPQGRKYIWPPYGDQKDLMFRLTDDPGERRDLTKVCREEAAELAERLRGLIGDLESTRMPAEDAIPGVSFRKLGELGYGGKDK